MGIRSGSGDSRGRRFWAVVTRCAAIVAIGSALGLLSNALHPMGVPLTLHHAKHPGIPLRVWNAVEKVPPPRAHALWKQQSVIFVDVRDTSDYVEAHIPGSISLPYHEFTTAYPLIREQFPEHEPILIYCYGSECGLSMRVAKRLVPMGYEKLIVLSGGIIAWRNAGHQLSVPGRGSGKTAEGERP